MNVVYYANSIAARTIILNGDVAVNLGQMESMESQSVLQNKQEQARVKSDWLISLNCRSLLPNIEEMRLIFTYNHPSIIAVTETWLNNTISDDKIHIQGYRVIQKDQLVHGSGGKHSLELEDHDFEAIWIEGKINKTKYVIGCVYRAPDAPVDDFFNYLNDVVRVETWSGKEVIITGYLNCNCLNNTLQQMGRMEEFLMANVLTQLITEPTRVTSSTCSLIEVLITSTPD